MKFAKELDEELAPEWRAKYLDYRLGKKKVKAIGRAIQKSNRAALSSSLQRITNDRENQLAVSAGYPPVDSSKSAGSLRRAPCQATPVPTLSPSQQHERQPLRSPVSRLSTAMGSYGSVAATPPQPYCTAPEIASIKLPDPAIDVKEDSWGRDFDHQRQLKPPLVASSCPDALPNAPTAVASSSPERDELSIPGRAPRFLRRVFSYPDREKPRQENQDFEIQRRQHEFFSFLDSELQKIETFYQTKETEATQRLRTLREQLHIMRDRRIKEVSEQKLSVQHGNNDLPYPHSFILDGTKLKDTIIRSGRVGRNSMALVQLATPGIRAQDAQAIVHRRDFSRRQELHDADVPYRSAKKKLKHALQEFYRSLELIKSYSYLNRIAFRKINKKYDKVAHTQQPMKYFSEKINGAWFVQSEVVEGLMTETEGLYARYFERGNFKIAVSKLRRPAKKSGDFSQSSFRSGVLIMGGILFGVQALVYAAQNLNYSDSSIRLRTSYLLQLYGGLFLIIFHVLLFCLDCMVWTKSRINYVFVFEFDPRHALDWRQLSELPSLFLFLLGLFMWLNFRSIDVMYVYWPVVLIGSTTAIVFLPVRLLYHRSRKWWAFSNWRLLLAGLYPVEFRDFFLGDMYCSQTYAMGNIELFFCLYAKHWDNPVQCSSSGSRLFGFFQCLPAVWRAFQCLRRFQDTKNSFPHLANFVKYICSILYYATLSMYRIDRAPRFQATFITFALVNAIYCSAWDLAMDWSLCNPHAERPMLRRVLAFHRPWVYYAAMVVDVVIRFNWIFYAIFTHHIGHAAVLSFMVCFSEVCRRGIWSIFRVENEHCTNVVLFRASRDVPLPYEPLSTDGQGTAEPRESVEGLNIQDVISRTSGDIEGGMPPASDSQQRRRSWTGSVSRVGEIVATAHAQDFQRTRRSGQIQELSTTNTDNQSPDNASEEECDEGSLHAHEAAAETPTPNGS